MLLALPPVHIVHSHLYLKRKNHKMLNKRKPLLRIASWYVLFLPIISSTLLLYSGVDWKWWVVIVSQFILFYPLICFVFQFVFFYEDCMVIIRPLNPFRMKRIITYNQIDHIKDVFQGRTTAVMSPYDLLVYIHGKKQPVGIPMPSSSKKQESLKTLIESKGVRAEWGIYGNHF